MQAISIRVVASLTAALAMAGCVSIQQPDGTIRRSFSPGSLFGDKPEPVQSESANVRPVLAPVAPAIAPPIAAGKARTAVSPAAQGSNAGVAIGARARTQLQQVLSCASSGKNFGQAETVLRQIGWTSSQGVEPVELPEPVKVFGFDVTRVAITREGDVHTYRSYLPEVNQKRLLKAAALKLDKDTHVHARTTKLGKLEAGTDGGETTLTCTIKADLAASQGK